MGDFQRTSTSVSDTSITTGVSQGPGRWPWTNRKRWATWPSVFRATTLYRPTSNSRHSLKVRVDLPGVVVMVMRSLSSPSPRMMSFLQVRDRWETENRCRCRNAHLIWTTDLHTSTVLIWPTKPKTNTQVFNFPTRQNTGTEEHYSLDTTGTETGGQILTRHYWIRDRYSLDPLDDRDRISSEDYSESQWLTIPDGTGRGFLPNEGYGTIHNFLLEFLSSIHDGDSWW